MLSLAKRFFRYSFANQILLIWLALTIRRIDHSLNVNGLAKTRIKMAAWRPGKFLYIQLEVRELSKLTNTACRYSIGMDKSCLRRSMLLWWLLQNQDVQCDLCMGLEKSGTSLTGHAWLELDGIVINEAKNIRERFACVDNETFWKIQQNSAQ